MLIATHGQKVKTVLILGTYLFITSLMAKTISDDREQKRVYRQKCLEIKEFLVDGRYQLDCFTNYHHYNSRSYKENYSKNAARKAGKVKIASYNLLYPGTSKSAFKDYKFLARIINRWDVVGAVELLPVVGRDLKNNNAVIKFLNDHKNLVVNHDKIGKLGKTFFQLESDQLIKRNLKEARKLYRAPGYLKIFEELLKLDSSWSLILSPRGDAARPTNVHELVGFFYRSSIVKPTLNKHCHEYKNEGDGIAFACLPNLRRSFMGRETSHVFSRRPFLGSFQSGNFNFSLVASHVIYSSPDEAEEMQSILKPAFKVEDYQELGPGATKQNYARLAELRVTLEFMEKLRKKYDEKDVILASDTNIVARNPFWSQLFNSFPGAELLINEATTLTQTRYDSDGAPTGGLSSSYDHFIIDPYYSSECVSEGESAAGRFSYFSGAIQSSISRKYIVRSKDQYKSLKDGELRYRLTAQGKEKMERHLRNYRQKLEKVKTIRNGKIVFDNYKIDERVKAYKERVFMQQLEDKTYYRVYSEVLSDHLPIILTCSNK